MSKLSIMRRRFATLLIGLFLAAGAARAVSAGLPDVRVAPTPEQSRITGQILEKLNSRHYHPLPIDDALSAHFLDELLDVLDPMRWYFLASDIKEFQGVRHDLDDQVLRGDLEEMYGIFNRFQERRLDHWTELAREAREDLDGLRFDLDDSLPLDRSEAPWPADRDEALSMWRLRFKNDVLNLRLADRTNEQIKDVLTRRYDGQIRRIGQTTSEDAFRVCMNVLTGCFDPHTEYFPPRDATNFDIQMSLKVEGIGALLRSDGEYTSIVRIIPGGPAEASEQLAAGDRILSVAQGDEEAVDTVGWRVDEVADLVRGPKGTVVRLRVLPAGENDEAAAKTVTIVRDEVKLEEQAAKSRVVEVGESANRRRIGVIELPAFYVDFDALRHGDEDYKSSTRDVRELLTKLSGEKVDGVVLDLRENGGGGLYEAVQLGGLLVGAGPIVQVRTAEGDLRVLGNREGRPLLDRPLVVLVNRLSASASEIVAGAVKDVGRGLIVGTRTFGKGTVQELIPIGEGQLKLTQAKFYRVTGESTQHRGVAPDIAFPAVYDPEAIGEDALDDAMPWDRIDPVEYPHDDTLNGLLPLLRRRHQARVEKSPDFNAMVARLELVNRQGDQKRLSLNEAERKREREERKARLLAIENERRKALGLEPVTTLADASGPDSDNEGSGDGQAASPKVDDDDPLLREAAWIAADIGLGQALVP